MFIDIDILCVYNVSILILNQLFEHIKDRHIVDNVVILSSTFQLFLLDVLHPFEYAEAMVLET